MSEKQQRTGVEVLQHIRELQEASLKAARREWLKLFPLQVAIALGFWGGGAAIFYWADRSVIGQLILLLFISAGFWLWPTSEKKSPFFYITLHILMLGVAFVMWAQPF